VPERDTLEQTVRRSCVSSRRLRRCAARQLAGRAARSDAGRVFACAATLPSKDCDRRNHASNSERASCLRSSPALNSAELRVELHGALELHCICGVAYFARS
jgi:hypothetical protein